MWGGKEGSSEYGTDPQHFSLHFVFRPSTKLVSLGSHCGILSLINSYGKNVATSLSSQTLLLPHLLVTRGTVY